MEEGKENFDQDSTVSKKFFEKCPLSPPSIPAPVSTETISIIAVMGFGLGGSEMKRIVLASCSFD